MTEGAALSPSKGPRWLARLAESSDTPRRTAAAFALGIFLSFSPFLGLQIVTGLTLAFALRLSRVATLVGLCVNLPLIMVPWYTLTTAAGAYALGVPIAVDFPQRLTALFALPFYRAVFWEHAFELVAPFGWPFVVGSTVGAIVVGAVSYVALVPVVASIQRRRP